MDPIIEKILPIYNSALEDYKSRKFIEAKAKFEQCLELRPNDGPSKLYIERCTDYIREPPDENWDGVFTMKTK